ncbi:ferrous iron transport protein B [bacterium]|nr:ferrous iron transport protein B [bacterium]
MQAAAEQESTVQSSTTPEAASSHSLRSRRIRLGSGSGEREEQVLKVALIGKPNSGKSTLFNALTGMRQKVANYPGVTVEKREAVLTWKGRQIRLVDLPGTYSLNAVSEDESLVRDLLLGLDKHETRPDLLLLIVDAANPERCLFLASQMAELGIPVLLALTMGDEARRRGLALDISELRSRLGAPVYEVCAPRGEGLKELKDALLSAASATQSMPAWSPAGVLASVLEQAQQVPGMESLPSAGARRQAALLLLQGQLILPAAGEPATAEKLQALRQRLDAEQPQWRQNEAQWRYDWVHSLLAAVRQGQSASQARISAVIDSVLTHPVYGLLVFALVMAVLFQSIFSWASPLMDLVDGGFAWLGSAVGSLLPEGPLRGLLVDGVIGGVGSVVIFLPQILLLFLFITILEDSGYMARAAFMMHKHMRRSGLHGRSFIPMLSGFACAIPAIMATRSIPDRRDRLVTMLAVPFISCSARLPVYALMIACFIPALPIFAGFTLQGAVLWSAYIVSVLAAIVTAFLLRRTVLRGENSPFVMELPPYRLPNWRNVLMGMWERGRLFLVQAGTVILCLSIVLWFLTNYPKQPQIAAQYDQMRTDAAIIYEPGEQLDARLEQLDQLQAAEEIKASFAGRLGHAIEPLIKPLGFDWKIGIGLIASFAAREVLVSTLAIVYGVGEADESSQTLQDKLKQEVDPVSGKPVFNVLVAINLMLFFILACQCMSTVAVVKRETNSWKWPLFMVGYMTAVAYLVCLLVYQVASRIWPGLA